MRPQIVTALCLLTVGACAHQQQPREQSASDTRIQETQTASTQASPPAMDSSRPPTTASQPGPGGMGMSPPQTAQSSANAQQQATTQQPTAAMPAAGAASQAGQTPPQTASQGDTDKLLDRPIPPDPSEIARAPAKEDIELRERIQSTLGTAPNLSYSARHVGVTVEKSDVTLHGDVRNDRERKEVEALVRQIQGVQKVKNQLSSVSQSTYRPPAR